MSESSKTSVVWKILPWLLLAAVLVAFIWVYIGQKTSQQSAWEPPRNEANSISLDRDKLSDKPEPVLSYHDAVAKASRSVVNIYTTQNIPQNPYMDDPILRRFYEFHGQNPQASQETNLGSGVIVSADGYIVTNAHVIAKADEIVVALNDGRKAVAKVVGTDPDSDLAVIKVDMQGLEPLAFREKPIEVGDVALAIGNPFGVGQTVTQGIISATGRTGLGVNTFEDFIQTDAAINPGNSGGALVDARGELVGINTLIFSRSGGSMGIGFAIPTALVEQVMNAIIKDGKVSRGWLGIEVLSQLRDPSQIDSTTGVVVRNIIPGSPAAKSGLKVGDVILSIDGVEMTDSNTLIQHVARKMPNSVLAVQVVRGSKNMNIDITLAERPTQTEVAVPMEIPADPELLLEPDPNGPPLTDEQRAQLREELIQLFENGARPKVDPIPQ
ncbi:S1C family serine protease [Psychrobacter sanguinis]|uniref:S1C family serine protease n=1 Tax=Psychrobacter sanguinis TaxID=861445 RepID=UPI00020C7EA1|nr:trypsin-like peptidase domain-containing protein [Psychrobacter sanguinis]EGK10937.1 trypsin domain protein [Psychrobacter sp. 1501(2011)]MCC3307394.1 trypsin-like peptidase domain-containing protein [Psychrobacter sanguinis]MCD9152675.1 trypsin-like peptidase domain-containing protein [Psychrobacter sanguinis]MDY3305700.1 trypsin-like peptidase domain-containing protein [Psychrobacter sanguinis]UEC24731.1 trypsin-like peptidase domain-containing protein [Psychrobacter sanguinis]